MTKPRDKPRDKPKCMWDQKCSFKDRLGFCDWDDTCNQQGFPFAMRIDGRLTIVFRSRQQEMLMAILLERDFSL